MNIKYPIYCIFLFILLMSSKTWSQCWERVPTPENYQIYDVDFINDSVGWVAGALDLSSTNPLDTTLIMKTIDGGQTWMYHYYDVNYPFEYTEFYGIELFFVNEQVGYAFAENHFFYKTIDGGINWTYYPLDPNLYNTSLIQAVEFADEDNGWVTFSLGGLLHTSDGGQTWVTQQAEIFPGVFFNFDGVTDIEFRDSNNGWVIVASPNTGWLYRTQDGGDTWEYIFQYQSPFYEVHFFNDSTGIILTWNKEIFRTTDAGATWAMDTVAFDNGLDVWSLNDMSFVNDSIGWIAGYNDYTGIVSTKDGGYTWQKESTPFIYNRVSNIDMTSPSSGWAVSPKWDLFHYNLRPPCEGISPILELPLDFSFSSEGTLIEWDAPDVCVDGFIVRMGTSANRDSFAVEDVGLNYSFLYDQPISHDSIRVYTTVTPYNNMLGSGEECEGDDSFVVLPPPLPAPIDTFICEGEAFYWDGNVFEYPGVYEIPYMSEWGHDSTITLNLQWYEPPMQTVVDTMLMTGEVFNGQVIENDTIYSSLFPAVSGCDSIVTYIVNIITDTKDASETQGWQLAPNPATDKLYIMSKYPWQEAALFDPQGRQIRQWQKNAVPCRHELNISGIAPGLYFLKVDAEQPVVMRVVVM